MSVFTPLSDQDIREFLSQFDVGNVLHTQGISGGSENTNYFVECSSGSFVLTLVERGRAQDLPFFINLLDCLHGAGLPVPFAFRNRQGQALLSIRNKPALLQPRLPGAHPDRVSTEQCAALGQMLSVLHSASCGLQRHSDRDPQWVLQESQILSKTIWFSEQEWLSPCLSALKQWLKEAPQLPRAVIHGDLFRDNAMFEGNRISGIIDFYNAATGWTLMELAICANDWCVDMTDQGPALNQTRVDTLLNSYAQKRVITAAEKSAWPFVLQLAALRFWLSRQQYVAQHRDKPGVLIKDPDHFRQLLKMHYLHAAHIC